MSDSVTIRVPATTANLGPGYDCLGVALQIYNRVTVTRGETPSGQGGMAAEAAEAFFLATGHAPFAFGWSVEGDVPRSRGLGSSVTVRLGLLHGLNVLSELPLHPQRLFELCARLEGHPDNAAPAAFGGFTVAGGAEVARFEVRAGAAVRAAHSRFRNRHARRAQGPPGAARALSAPCAVAPMPAASPPPLPRPITGCCAGRSPMDCTSLSEKRSFRFCHRSSRRAKAPARSAVSSPAPARRFAA